MPAVSPRLHPNQLKFYLLSQKVLHPSEALARQIPSESSSNFKLLLESEESKLLWGDLLDGHVNN